LADRANPQFKAQRRSGKEFIFPSGAPRSPKRTDPDIRIVAELSGTWSRPWRRELIGDLETGRWRRTAAINPEAARNAGLLLGFQRTKTARRKGISSPFSDAGGCTSPQNSGTWRAKSGSPRDRTLIRVVISMFARFGARLIPGPRGDGPGLVILADQ
jgi:hypothetical protein